MARLMVITCPTGIHEDKQPGQRPYEVILGDGVLPGFVLGTYDTSVEADSACKAFGRHYNLRAYPMDTPWKPRGQFIVLQGGKSASQHKGDTK